MDLEPINYVPSDVLESLNLETRKIYSDDNDNIEERIVFYESPLYFKGFFNFSTLMVAAVCYIPSVVVGLSVILSNGYLVGYLSLISTFIFIFTITFLLHYKWYLFSHRIVTNHRVILLITKPYLCFSSSISNVYFQATMERYAYGKNNNNTTNNNKNNNSNKNKSNKNKNHFATLEYGDGEGRVIINGADTLILEHVKDIRLLEDALVKGIRSTTIPQTFYSIKVTIPYYQRMGRRILIKLMATFLFLIGSSVEAYLLAVGGDWRQAAFLSTVGSLGFVFIIFIMDDIRTRKILKNRRLFHLGDFCE